MKLFFSIYLLIVSSAFAENETISILNYIPKDIVYSGSNNSGPCNVLIEQGIVITGITASIYSPLTDSYSGVIFNPFGVGRVLSSYDDSNKLTIEVKSNGGSDLEVDRKS